MWYGVAVQSQFAYLWSFHEPPTEVKQLERISISEVMAIPHQSIPLTTFYSANAIGLTASIREMQLSSIAARCRVYMKSELFPIILDELHLVEQSIECIYIHPHKVWKKESAIQEIEDAFVLVHSIAPVIPDILATNLRNNIFNMLLPCAPPYISFQCV